MSNFKIYIFLIITPFFISSCAYQPLRAISVDKNVLLAAEDGYLFLALATDIGISSVEIDGPKRIEIINFNKFEKRNYFLGVVPKGQYKISKINLWGNRFYLLDNEDLPFSFTVKPETINYVGEVRLKRLDSDASIELINRSSLALEYLDEKFPELLLNRSIKYEGPGNDSFFNAIADNRKKILLKKEVVK